MKTPDLETDRLILRTIRAEDIIPIFECWMQDENVSRYMLWKASDDIRETEKFVDFELGNIESDLWYRWIIENKITGEMIGTCLIYYNDDASENHWDISYSIGAAHWGKGYVTEAMHRVMLFAEEKLGTDECITTYAKENAASGKVLKKLSFKFVDEEPYLYHCGEFETIGIRVKWQKQKAESCKTILST